MSRINHDELTQRRDDFKLGIVDFENQEAQRQADADRIESQELVASVGEGALAPDQYNYAQAKRDGVDLQDEAIPARYTAPGAVQMFGRDLASNTPLVDPSGGYFAQHEAAASREPAPGEGVGVPPVTAPVRVVANAVYGFLEGVGALAEDYGEGIPAGAPSWKASGLRNAAGLVAQLQNLPRPEALEATSGLLEDIATDILQFVMGYAAAPLKLAGAPRVAGEMGRGAQASQVMSAEDTVGSTLAEAGLLPDALWFLNSKGLVENDQKLLARLGQGVEEGVLTATGAALIYGGLRTAKRIRQAEGDTLIQRGMSTLLDFGSGQSPRARQRGSVDISGGGAQQPPGAAVAGEAVGEVAEATVRSMQAEELLRADMEGLTDIVEGLGMKGMEPDEIRAWADSDGRFEPEQIDAALVSAEERGVLARLETLQEREPALAELRPHLTPRELETLAVARPHNAAAKIRDAARVLNRIDIGEMSAAALAGEGKRGWYRESAEALMDIFGPADSRRFAALLAATSPQTSVESNLANTVGIWANWVRAGRPTNRDEILDIMGASVQGSKGRESILPAWISNSLRALQTADPETIVLSGPKVDSFMRNLQGEFDEVTNDTWMAHFADIAQPEFSGSLRGTDPGKMGGYLGMSAATRKTAEALTEATGEVWTPAEVQETVWSFMKVLTETRAGSGDVPATELVAGLDVRETPDFGTLLESDEALRSVLTGAGYGGQLGEYAAGRAARTGGPAPAPAAGDAGQPGDLEAVAQRVERLHRERGVGRALRDFRPGRTGAGRRAAAGATSRGYQSVPRGRGSTHSLSFGGQGRPVAPTAEFEAAAERAGFPAPHFYELTAKSKPRFKEALASARERHWLTESSVDLKPSYKDDTVYLTDDGKAGFAVAQDGEIHSVFSSGGGMTPAMLQAAVENGGTWLYAFDTVLPKLYARNGFKPVARLPWNDEFAPPSWDYASPIVSQFNGGRPDLVFMVYDPEFDLLVRHGSGGKQVNEYDDAMNIIAGQVRGQD